MSKSTVIAKRNFTEEEYKAFATETGKKIAFSRTLKMIAGFYEATPETLQDSVDRRVRAKRKYGSVPTNPITVILQYLDSMEASQEDRAANRQDTINYQSQLEAAFYEQTKRKLNADVAQRFEQAYLIVQDVEAAA
jgi:hypothetical protein